MNRILVLLTAMLFLLAVPLAAQKKKSVLLKFNKESGVLRIVFEGEEAFINKIKVMTSSTQIRMEFPEPFELRSRKELPFEIIPSEKTVLINLSEKVEIKFFRLSDPARLVIDIDEKGSENERHSEAPFEEGIPTIRADTVVIDAGHGGYDFGLSYGNLHEKDVNLALARELRAALKRKGKKVFLIRKADLYVSISDRIEFVNEKNPDIFISLHASMSGNFVLYEPIFNEQVPHDYRVAFSQRKYASRSKIFSDSIEKAIKDEFKDGVMRRSLPLPLLNSAGAPSVFLEYPSPEIFSYDQEMKTRIIQAIIQGMTVYAL